MAGSSNDADPSVKAAMEAAGKAANPRERDLAARAVTRMGFKEDGQLGTMTQKQVVDSYLYLRSIW